ncbi:hypothetical protein NDN08_000868 [Rhodosorus marinus]|uniref:TIP41-like protein n=1 Tax=Rhodosorus marinus TaxID=101924 RepID=A0AAV8UT90_9RHOD|nr:hypothetical protein NDN08_000868 [Rhodosorus marinus]
MELFEDGKGIAVGDWQFRVEKGPIGSSEETDSLSSKLNMKLPGMVFTKNVVELDAKLTTPSESKESVFFKMSIDPVGALRGIGKNDPRIQVKAAKHWDARRAHEDVQVIKAETDWTFSSTYMGDIVSGISSIEENTTRGINIEKLKRRDIPVLYFNEAVLYEDELDDNGTSCYNVRLRVSEGFFLLLARFWLRVDGVVGRLYETRYYYEFGTDAIVRDWKRQESFLQDLGGREEVLQTPERASKYLKTVAHGREALILSK